MNEGDVQIPPAGAYGISYRCCVPGTGQCPNLFVPVCVSTSHIAYGSARMEPVFMALAQSCAVAASMALKGKLDVQNVDAAALEAELVKIGQVTRHH
jgi:hypothetical protein